MNPSVSTRRTVRAVAMAATLAATGRATGSPGQPRPDPDRITFEELDEYGGPDVLSAIQSLRPQWLRTRYQNTFGALPIAVFVDDMAQTEPAGTVLRRIPLGVVREIRYVAPAEAAGRYGGLAGGAILIHRRESGMS
jgi:hypothetical protein